MPYKKMTKKEIAEYQKKLDEARQRKMYAECFTPHKVQYYTYILTDLLINAPVQCI